MFAFRHAPETPADQYPRSETLVRNVITYPDMKIVFEIGETILIARIRPEDAQPTGEMFDFGVDMIKAKPFDAETSQAISKRFHREV